MPNYSGIWTEQAVMQAVGAGNWPGNPGAPTIGTATGGNASASVTFTAPTDTGQSAIVSYTVTSSPGGLTGTGSASPITVSGLTNGTAYTFTVTATNATGTGPASAASNSVTPVEPPYIEEVYSTYLYTGNGSTQNIINGLDLLTKGGMVWSHSRSNVGNHELTDTVTGAGKRISSDDTGAQNNFGDVSAFLTNGYSLSNVSGNINGSGKTAVSWSFRKQPKFFDVVTYSGTGADMAVNHNLQAQPGCVIIKRTNAASDWQVMFPGLISDGYGGTGRMFLNTTAAYAATGWTSVANSTQITIPTNLAAINEVGGTYVAYLFASNAGGFGSSGTDNVITCGSYVGNGSASGPVINLGYEPQWVLAKGATDVSSWRIGDNMRGLVVGGDDSILIPNSSAAETLSTWMTPTATGFQIDGTSSAVNTSGSTYIYIAIRRGPMKVPTAGTSVFNPYTATLSAGTAVTAGLTPDLLIGKYRAGTDAPRWVDRLRGFASATGGTNPQLRSDTADAEASSTAWSYNWNNTGYIVGNALNGLNSVIYSIGRAPSFFDEVCWTRSSSQMTLNHNLGTTPQLIIKKDRSRAGTYWEVLPNVGSYDYRYVIYLNDTQAISGPSSIYWGAAPTATTFDVNMAFDGSSNGDTFVAYLFATCAGVSKVGSYTGTGATQTINCGFISGARFVMVKRTDSTGDWFYWDTARGMVSGTDPYLLMNSNVGETNTNSIYTASTGFEIVSTAAGINASGGTYIFLAIA